MGIAFGHAMPIIVDFVPGSGIYGKNCFCGYIGITFILAFDHLKKLVD